MRRLRPLTLFVAWSYLAHVVARQYGSHGRGPCLLCGKRRVLVDVEHGFCRWCS